MNSLGWDIVTAGRLVHLRIFGMHRPLDIVAIYQHVYNGSRECLQKRRVLWQSLDNLLGRLPRRNYLLVAGDFNTSVPDIPHLVGSIK